MNSSLDQTSDVPDLALRATVENFLYLEARLMDANRYSQWLELYADPCTYWIPSNDESSDPATHVSILYGDRRMLENHVQRLVDGHAYAQSPPSRLLRVVSNIEIYQRDAIQVFANFQITEVRRHTQRLHAGRSEYELISDGSGLLVRSKKITLTGIDEPQENITFLL